MTKKTVAATPVVESDPKVRKSRAYIAMLKAADLVVASAGLHSYYELYVLRKNVLFLPPQSYSQYLQLKFITDRFKGVVSATYEQLGVAHGLKDNMPEAERITEVKARP